MKALKSIIAVALILFTASCTSYKSVPYFQNSEEVDTKASSVLHENKIVPLDGLSIIVSSFNPQASSMFNLNVPSRYNIGQQNSSTQYGTIQTYIVDNAGYVDIPNIGKVKVAGLTRQQAEALITEKVKATGIIKESFVVTVRFTNFKISVLGEVTSPGSYVVTSDKIDVLTALALAKDLTIYGCRDNVKLIREDPSTGQKQFYTLNLNDANLVNSPYYYLQQNDVLYVTPNKAKAKNSDIGSSTTLWFSATSILISLTSLLYNILKN